LTIAIARSAMSGQRLPSISASVGAIVNPSIARDAAMVALHQVHPQYAFDQHKGYPTRLHLTLLREHGVSSVHRRSYAPVRKLLEIDDVRREPGL
jgi:ribonuclease HII